jgi:hypothetical protein
MHLRLLCNGASHEDVCEASPLFLSQYELLRVGKVSDLFVCSVYSSKASNMFESKLSSLFQEASDTAARSEAAAAETETYQPP